MSALPLWLAVVLAWALCVAVLWCCYRLWRWKGDK
jgi:hypothetical protein